MNTNRDLAAFEAANALRREGRESEARGVIRRAKEHAIASEDVTTAAFYSSVLASCYLGAGEDERARTEYENAARLDPAEISHSLALADFLVVYARLPGAAVDRLEFACDNPRAEAHADEIRRIIGLVIQHADGDEALRGRANLLSLNPPLR